MATHSNILIQKIPWTEACSHSTCGCRVQLSGGSVVKNLPSNIGDMGSIPGREPGLLLS